MRHPRRCRARQHHGHHGRNVPDRLGAALVGHREWDQATAAWHRDVFGASPDDYTAFAHVYGNDVTAWPGYQVIRDIRSLCTTLFALRHATASPEGRDRADHRLACLRGTAGPTPNRGAPGSGGGPVRQLPAPY